MDELTAQEEIAFIKKVMNDSRKIIIEDGIEYIYWGILVTICLLYTFFSYFNIDFNKSDPSNRVFIFWLVAMILGGFGSSLFLKKRHRSFRVKSLAGTILGKIWLANGIGMILTAFVGSFTGAIHGVYISPLMSCFLGGSYYISGFVYGKKWISNLAFLWWLGAAEMFVFPGLYTVLIMAMMIILFQITPGIILYIDSKKEFAKLNNE